LVPQERRVYQMEDTAGIIYLAIWDTWLWQNYPRLSSPPKFLSRLCRRPWQGSGVFLFRLQRFTEAKSGIDGPIIDFSALQAMYQDTPDPRNAVLLLREWTSTTISKFTFGRA
jgi:hypothetical protein